MNPEDIEKLQIEIDKIDDKLVELLIKRFELTSQVNNIKRANSIDIEDKNREEAIISRYINTNLPEGYIDKFFNNLFDEEKKLAKNE